MKVTLGKSKFGQTSIQSFNNDSVVDERRNSFHDVVSDFKFNSEYGNPVPSEYLHPNVHHYFSHELYGLEDKIVIGEYCNDGIIVPRTHSIIFCRLYNCSPLISIIKGDPGYISFLHTWAEDDYPRVVDKQVKHWMNLVSQFGDILETVFAPRHDTEYKTAISDIAKTSQKTIILQRDIREIIGITNTNGVYFKKCGYHLWTK